MNTTAAKLTAAADRVRTAADLDSLRDALIDFHECARIETRGLEYDASASYLDPDDIPQFGGAEPSDTEAIWSWDAESVLEGCSWTREDLSITPRAELGA